MTTSSSLRRGAAVLAASGSAFAIWAVAAPGLGLDLAGPSNTVVGPASVLTASLVAGLLAWGLVALLERFTPRARFAWRALAGIALVLSLAGPLLGGFGAAATVALVLMHVVVGGILLVWLAPRPR
jgi:Family of unknown function (DUF6069)